jgi:hypothetical protein
MATKIVHHSHMHHNGYQMRYGDCFLERRTHRMMNTGLNLQLVAREGLKQI